MGFFKAEGLYTIDHWWNIMCNPPLCITEAGAREGLRSSIADSAITNTVITG